MKIQLFLFLLCIILISPSLAYPQNELGAILTEKYPHADFGRDIIIKDDGDGVYIQYSTLPIPNATEAERLWGIVQEKRVLEAQNQTEKLLSKQDLQIKYQVHLNNLNTVVNNSNYIQAKTNWTNAEVIQQMKVLAWHDEVLAKGEIVILKILRWML